MIKGKWYKPGSAARSRAVLYLDEEEYRLEPENSIVFPGKIKDIHVSDRLGDVERKLTFHDGSVFATQDNDAVDRYFKSHAQGSSLLHAMESRLSWAVIALVVTIAFSISFFKWGVPWISENIAHALPQETNVLIAANTLEFLDKYIFEETTLDPEQFQTIRNHFNTKLVPLDNVNESVQYTLHFRDWSDGDIGIPNALALPSGDIVLTDEFVRLCKTQDEMDSVLLHEMGHVIHRHSLEMVIEATFVTVAIMLITGDNNGVADMGIGLGSLLVSTHYSRNHETEADHYAFEKMLKAGIDPKAFSAILTRITESIDELDNVDEEEVDPKNSENGGVWDYISTHPSTEKRVQQAGQYSECFQQGLLTCEVDQN